MSLDPLTFIFEILNFLVLLWLLKRFLYKPVQAAINQRREDLQKAMQLAQQREAQASAAMQQHQQALQAWQQEQARREAELNTQLNQQREQVMAAIAASAEVEKQRLNALAAQEQKTAQAALQHKAARNALQLSARLLQRVSGPELDSLLITMLLEDLQKLPAQQRNHLHDSAQQQQGRILIESARPLNAQQCTALQQGLSAQLGLDVQCNYQERADLISGLRASWGADVLHANLADELAFFHTGLMHV
ncbi:MAG: hypothetical protein H7A09_09740 [Oceanospirillaceae bacterium]|nr:hypothetical protein [Oceanospirillaceae bacterium]MCP5335179.1 hypothetical protein [Oceanospirillaceae bacterium]MCP5351516.1 hypothetical protein [Oceanospirillaceae bacterium]